MERLFLVDGHNLLFRMFYGMPPISAGDGTYMHAVVGCMGALIRSIDMLRPSRMLVLFDSPDNGDRRSLCADYKANRPDYSAMAPEDCPFTQLPLLYRTLSHSGIPYAEIHGCEADDAIAAYARQTPDDWDVVICSTDRDYFQLIDDRVSVFLYKGYDSSLVTPESVFARYGVSPQKFADFKCLVGDHSDNITGIPGIGPKRAAVLLNRFDDLAGICAHVDEVPYPSVRKALRDALPILERNRALIALAGDAPLPVSPESLSVNATHLSRASHMSLIYEAMEDGSAENDDALCTEAPF